MRRILFATLLLVACGDDPEPKDPPAGPPLDTSALDALNGYRALMGLPETTSNKQLTQASQAHVDYYLLNQGINDECAGPSISPHYEVAGCEGFTGEAPWDRTAAAGYGGVIGECIAFYNDGPRSIYEWLATVYHRFCIAAPEVFEIGFAKGAEPLTGSKIDVIEVGHLSTLDPSYVGRWPIPGATDVPKSWDGYEDPQPPIPPTGYPSGPIIGAIYGPDDDVVITSVTLSDHTGVVPSIVLTPTNDSHLENSKGYFIYSYDPLLELREYTVRLSGTRGGGAYTDQWSFFVPCDRSMPDDGRACNGNTLLSCNIDEPMETDCGTGNTCVEYSTGARCIEGTPVSCNQPDNTFLRCSTNEELIYCLGGYELVVRDCDIDTCIEGPHGPTCAADPITTCPSIEEERMRCVDNYLVMCALGYIQHQDCGELFCQVDTDGDRGYCAASRAPCSRGRCAGQVPIDCIDNWEIPGPICESPLECFATDNEATCE